jgi:hypothetical protein
MSDELAEVVRLDGEIDVARSGAIGDLLIEA